MDEIVGGGALLPFQLEFQQFERSVVAAADEKAIC